MHTIPSVWRTSRSDASKSRSRQRHARPHLAIKKCLPAVHNFHGYKGASTAIKTKCLGRRYLLPCETVRLRWDPSSSGSDPSWLASDPILSAATPLASTPHAPRRAWPRSSAPPWAIWRPCSPAARHEELLMTRGPGDGDGARTRSGRMCAAAKPARAPARLGPVSAQPSAAPPAQQRIPAPRCCPA